MNPPLGSNPFSPLLLLSLLVSDRIESSLSSSPFAPRFGRIESSLSSSSSSFAPSVRTNLIFSFFFFFFRSFGSDESNLLFLLLLSLLGSEQIFSSFSLDRYVRTIDIHQYISFLHSSDRYFVRSIFIIVNINVIAGSISLLLYTVMIIGIFFLHQNHICDRDYDSFFRYHII